MYITALALTPLLYGWTVASKCPSSQFTTEEYLNQTMYNYLGLWNGNMSLISILSPNVSLQCDVFVQPSGTGTLPVAPSVTNSTSFQTYVQWSRESFESYVFTLNKVAASGNHVSGRWTLNAVLPQNFTLAPTPLKPGDEITYNGTDFLTLDPCTGLIVEVTIAQDLLTFITRLGDQITLTPQSRNGDREQISSHSGVDMDRQDL